MIAWACMKRLGALSLRRVGNSLGNGDAKVIDRNYQQNTDGMARAWAAWSVVHDIFSIAGFYAACGMVRLRSRDAFGVGPCAGLRGRGCLRSLGRWVLKESVTQTLAAEFAYGR